MVSIRKKEVTNSGKRMMVGRAVTLFTPVGVLFSTVTVDTIVDSLHYVIPLCHSCMDPEESKSIHNKDF